MPTQAYEKLAKANAELITKGGSAALAGFQELGKAYQSLATKNAEKLTASIQALSTVKSPSEFASLQQKLLTESVEAAIADSKHIAELTTAVFTAAFSPLQEQISALYKSEK